jgi:hypothetical protein
VQEQAGTPLSEAVARFGRAFVHAPDTRMDAAWAWDDYDSEGARFAALVTYGELCELAVRIADARRDRPPSTAQRILGQYHVGWRELEALLLGLEDDEAQRAPAKDAWSIREVLAHIAETDATFYVIARFAYERAQAGQAPEQAPYAYYDQVLGTDDELRHILARPLSQLWASCAQHHARVLADLSTIDDQLIDAGALFWESASYPIRYRLHRFDAHIRQHSIQVEKTLRDLGRQPTEARRLVRLVYRALGEVESAALGAPDQLVDEQVAVAAAINNRTGEIAALMS